MKQGRLLQNVYDGIFFRYIFHVIMKMGDDYDMYVTECIWGHNGVQSLIEIVFDYLSTLTISRRNFWEIS